MNPLRVVVIDDHPAIRKDAMALIEKYHEFIVVGSCGCVREALVVIPATNPDLLLLDINLGDGTGFDILDQIDLQNIRVIFLTAYQEHAIKAIKIGALDYLLKPLDEVELKDAFEKVLKSPPTQKDKLAQAKQYLLQDSQRIAISSQQKIQFINVREIVYCESNSGITTFFLSNNKKVVATKYIKDYESQLSPVQFIRTHQSYIVNLNFIHEYSREGYLIMNNGAKIPIATRKKEFVKKILTGNLD